MEFTLRQANYNDAPLIADISRTTFSDTFAADNTPEDMHKFLTQQFTKGQLMMEVADKNNSFWLAYAGEEVAGYLKLREGKKPEGIVASEAIEIARLYVLKEFIGTGCGKFLMKAALQVCSEKEKQVVWLGVWEKNRRAIAFYEAFGFVKFGEWDFLLGDDLQRDWLMKKELQESSAGYEKLA